MQRLLIPLILGATLAGACAGTTYSASATLATPDLVYVSPGVYAVAGFSDPIFYANNYYWRYDDGYWYRSRFYDRGWGYVTQPPRVISRIDRPYARYYRDRGRVQVDHRYRPDDRYRPREIREHRRVVGRDRGRNVRVIERDYDRGRGGRVRVIDRD
jgi:hypothetical protein